MSSFKLKFQAQVIIMNKILFLLFGVQSCLFSMNTTELSEKKSNSENIYFHKIRQSDRRTAILKLLVKTILNPNDTNPLVSLLAKKLAKVVTPRVLLRSEEIDEYANDNKAIFNLSNRLIAQWSSNQNRLYIRDTKKFAIINSFAFDKKIKRMSLSHNGKLLACVCADNKTTVIIKMKSWQKKELYIEFGLNPIAAALSSDGAKIAYAFAGKRLRDKGIIAVYDLNSCKRLALFEIAQSPVSIEFSPNNTFLVAHCTWHIQVWDSHNYKPLATLYDKQMSLGTEKSAYTVVGSVKISPDGSKIAAGLNNAIKVWDVATYKEIAHLPMDNINKEKDIIDQIAFSPDSSEIAAGGFNGFIFIWSLVKPAPAKIIFDHPDAKQNFGYSFSQDMFFCNNGSQLFFYSNKHTKKASKLSVASNLDEIKTLACNSARILNTDGTRLCIYHKSLKKLEVWDVPENILLTTIPFQKKKVSMHLSVFHKDKLVFPYDDGTSITIYDTNVKAFIADLNGFEFIHSCCISPSGTLLAIIDNTKYLKIWDIKKNIEIMRCDLTRALKISEISSFSPNEAQLILRDIHYTTYYLFDLQKKSCSKIFKSSSAIFSPDGLSFVVFENGLLKVIDPNTGNMLAQFNDCNYNVKSVESKYLPLFFNIDGSKLAVARSDGIIDIWNFKERKLITSIKTKAPNVTNLNEKFADERITQACFSLDDQILVTANSTLNSKNDAVCIWDVNSGTLLGSLQGLDYNIVSVRFISDKELLVKAYCGQVNVYNLEGLCKISSFIKSLYQEFEGLKTYALLHLMLKNYDLEKVQSNHQALKLLDPDVISVFEKLPLWLKESLAKYTLVKATDSPKNIA